MKDPFALACCLLVWMVPSLLPSLGTSTALCTPATGSAAPDPTKTTVSLEFKETPLRRALDILFQSTGFQYAVALGVPDIPITLKVYEMPFEQALRAMMRLADANGAPPPTYTRTGDLYLITPRRNEVPAPSAGGVLGGGGFGPNPGAASVMEKLPIRFLRPQESFDLFNQHLPPPGISEIIPLPRDNSLLVRGKPAAIQAFKDMVRLVDVAPRSLSISAGISGPGLQGAPLAIRSTARALVGEGVTIDERAATGGMPAHLKVALKTQLMGDGQLQVASDWDVSVPVAGGPRGPIRLVKRLSTTMLLRPGEQVPVAEVDLAGWGGKGVLRLWLRGEWGRREAATGKSRLSGPGGPPHPPINSSPARTSPRS